MRELDGGIGAGTFRYVPGAAGPGPARSLLSAWQAVEILTPRTYVREADLASGGEVARLAARRPAPWLAPRPPRKGHVLFHQVYLGSIPMGEATRRLAAALDGDPAVRGPDMARAADGRRSAKAAVASVLLDGSGFPVEGGAAVSSFAWALPSVLAGDPVPSGAWTAAEARLREALASRALALGEGGAPPSAADILELHAWVVEALRLPSDLVEPPGFCIRLQVRESARSDPGPAILNSYHLGDLERASATLGRGRLPGAARAYLGLDEPAAPLDVLSDKAALRGLLAPRLFPGARWPAPNRARLSTLQQAAANASGLLAGREGVLAVNGPPGTGKTTLLRDVVAACVLARAEAMSAFERPSDAFGPPAPGCDVRGRRHSPYPVHPSLKGHEVLVASSNNRAVENVSRELPTMRSVPPGRSAPSHLRSLADAVARAAADPEGKGTPLPDTERCWGLAAAVLGRSSNRRGFVETFWWDPDHGMRTRLALALGETPTVAVRGADGISVDRRPPACAGTGEVPASPAEALAAWASARSAFLSARARVEAILRAAEHAAGTDPDGDPHTAAEACEALVEEGLEAAAAVRTAEAALAEAEAAETSTRRLAGFAASASDGPCAEVFRILGARAEAAAHLAAERRAGLEAARTHRRDLVLRYREAHARLRRATEPRPEPTPLGSRADAAYFERGHAEWNLDAPWFDDAAHGERDALFAAAMRLHEAFAYAAAGPLRANLSGFAAAATGPAPGLDAHLQDLWASLFLVVPVVSTTFASVERMLSGLPDAGLGWLVVDEAGQATPQSAVGAVMRCRRAVFVGDPAQVEPVTSLPAAVTERIFSEHGLDAASAAAPAASAQTFADSASPLRGSFRTPTGRRGTGIPLLVHRRCDEPMFGIANAVAYDGQMVHGTLPSDDGGRIRSAIGPSRWIDVPASSGPGRWRPAEAEALLALLDALLVPGGGAPDLFVISPFRETADAARALLRRHRRAFSRAGASAESWSAARVGTIHAFQGREAEAVVLLLGASGDEEAPARRWAGRTPNILNVAVSRARRDLYVVGDRRAWEGAGSFRELAAALPAPPA